MDASSFNTLAFKLGVTSESIIKKAKELVRITESKNTTLTSLNVSSTSIAVMCIELAAIHNSHNVDKDTAIRMSSLPKKAYITAFKFVQQMLDMKQDNSISNLAVQFGCSEAKKLAEQILTRYQSSQPNLNLADTNAGLFNGASLYAACKKLKLKIDKSKLVTCIGVKRSVLDRLVAQLEGIATEMVATKKSTEISGNVNCLENIVDSIKDTHSEFACNDGKQTESDDEEEEDYYTWSKRIISQARAMLLTNS